MSTFRPWFDDPPRRSDVVTIPLFWLALLFSLLVHVAAIWLFLSREKPELLPGIEQNDVAVPMSVTLASAPKRNPPPAPTTPPPLPPQAPKAPRLARQAPPRPRNAPVLAALPGVQSPESVPMVTPPALAQTPPAPMPENMAGDLSSYIEHQRVARGEAPTQPNADPAADADARRNRAIAANLASSSSPTYYGEPKNSGGIFQVTFIGYDDAEFTFFGWDKDIRRRASQKIDVRLGNNANIRIAIVRKMIDIIRQYEKEDFTWKSDRLGHNITLSARPQDQAALEDFLMRDFFDELPRPQR